MRADQVREFGRSFLEIEAAPGRSGSIPYHRILRITRGGAVIWERARS